ncbi:glycoside hydrolase family 2 TIM barrel-domain containing protein [Thalassotalea nanhaiensis]|uniref:Glycoside hydrolase family 2 TIM barrel-domain containing protein n=1 Tax=Thalassotalea nanhaiensis TaxID=3065648 RepID=A0ABY9TMZ7_9GAMM|nr:glycoside hydrolase family 2 TIM barrel-domain containing protein [Colwelliaceae bacterium SQ345]
MKHILKMVLLLTLTIVGNTTVYAQKSHQNTLSLDGTWQIIFDKDNQSRANKTYKNSNFLAHKDIRNIEVPSVWERIEKDYEGVAVYRRTFNAPIEWQNKIAHISFDAVNYRAEVYLNDHVVGVHEGGFTPFSFRVDSMLNFDKENVLTLRVLGPILLDTDKVIDGMGAMETPQWRGGITGGIWQSVRVVVTDKSYISDVYVQPDLANQSANVTVSATNYDVYDSENIVDIEIREHQSDKLIVTKQINTTFTPGKNSLTTDIVIPNAKAWSPDSPNLYDIRVNINRNNALSDSVSERFGLREFTVKDKRFHLNGDEIYVKSVFLEGVYPVGVATPVDMELARKEIKLAKEAGFNMIRPWRRPPPPQWLDLADEMGVLVIGSPALECMDLPVNTPDLPKRVVSEIGKTIKRDRNRASIVMWELYNEVRRPILKQMMQETSMMARDLDPSRLILDESGGWAFGAKVFLPNEKNFVSFNDVHTYPGPNMTNAWFDKFLGVGYTKEEREAFGIKGKPIGHNLKPGVTSFVSELGYGSYVDFDKVNKRFSEQGNPIVPPTRYHKQLGSQLNKVLQSDLADIYKTPQEFFTEQQEIHGKANARMIEATRLNPNVTGYCVHALTGGDWIMGAGLLDLWRDPKPQVYERTKAANQPRILSIRTFPYSAYAGENVEVLVQGVNDLKSVKGTLHVVVSDSAGKQVWQSKKEINFAARISTLLEHSIDTSTLSGKYIVDAKVTDKHGNTIADYTYDFNVFATSKDNNIGTFALADQTGNLRAFLSDNQISFSDFNDNTSIDTPVVVAMASKPNKKQKTLNKQLKAFANKGGIVTYIQFPYIGPKWKSGVLSKGSAVHMPLSIKMKASTGLWAGMSHVVSDHPVFNNLPVNKAMQGIYENVRPKISMVDLKAKPIVTLVANDNFPDMTLMKRHYKGTGDVWVGSDLSEVDFGKGKLILSTMQIVPNLGKDPVADTLLINILSYITNR